jgi:hypothetical protein
MILAISVSCGKKKISGSGKILLPWPNAQGQYELTVVEVNTLKEPSSLTGDAAKILLDPRVSSDGLRGDRPSAHFVETNEGVLIPTDFISAQLGGVYAHAEKLWNLERAMGFEGLLEHPRKFGLKMRVTNDMNSPASLNNALYSAEHDAIIVMPYDPSNNPDDKQLPLGLNGGILAHEHFHALFNAFLAPYLTSLDMKVGLSCNFAQPSGAVTPDSIAHGKKLDINNDIIIRGFNEGLADFWGWIYTGDDDFIAHSLPKLRESRSLRSDKLEVKIFSKDDFMSIIKETSEKHPKSLDALPYELGTLIARELKIKSLQRLQLPIESSISAEERLKIGKVVLKMLSELTSDIGTTIKAKSVVETDLPVTLFEKAFSELK